MACRLNGTNELDLLAYLYQTMLKFERGETGTVSDDVGEPVIRAQTTADVEKLEPLEVSRQPGRKRTRTWKEIKDYYQKYKPGAENASYNFTPVSIIIHEIVLGMSSACYLVLYMYYKATYQVRSPYILSVMGMDVGGGGGGCHALISCPIYQKIIANRSARGGG